MRYPDEFDTSTFPAGKQIAVSRIVGIATMIVFLLIVFACGFLLWAQKSIRIHPFLVEINDVNGQWEIVGHQHTEIKEITTTQSLQESVIGKFLKYRFTITNDEKINSDIWGKCNRQQACKYKTSNTKNTFETNFKTEKCSLYCLSGQSLFSNFSESIVPLYVNYALTGDVWMPDMSSVQMLPIGKITDKGGIWQIRMTLNSKLQGDIFVLAYANIARNNSDYPKTLGFYVLDFNAYRIK